MAVCVRDQDASTLCPCPEDSASASASTSAFGSSTRMASLVTQTQLEAYTHAKQRLVPSTPRFRTRIVVPTESSVLGKFTCAVPLAPAVIPSLVADLEQASNKSKFVRSSLATMRVVEMIADGPYTATAAFYDPQDLIAARSFPNRFSLMPNTLHTLVRDKFIVSSYHVDQFTGPALALGAKKKIASVKPGATVQVCAPNNEGLSVLAYRSDRYSFSATQSDVRASQMITTTKGQEAYTVVGVLVVSGLAPPSTSIRLVVEIGYTAEYAVDVSAVVTRVEDAIALNLDPSRPVVAALFPLASVVVPAMRDAVAAIDAEAQPMYRVRDRAFTWTLKNETDAAVTVTKVLYPSFKYVSNGIFAGDEVFETGQVPSLPYSFPSLAWVDDCAYNSTKDLVSLQIPAHTTALEKTDKQILQPLGVIVGKSGRAVQAYSLHRRDATQERVDALPTPVGSFLGDGPTWACVSDAASVFRSSASTETLGLAAVLSSLRYAATLESVVDIAHWTVVPAVGNECAVRVDAATSLSGLVFVVPSLGLDGAWLGRLEGTQTAWRLGNLCVRLCVNAGANPPARTDLAGYRLVVTAFRTEQTTFDATRGPLCVESTTLPPGVWAVPDAESWAWSESAWAKNGFIAAKPALVDHTFEGDEAVERLVPAFALGGTAFLVTGLGDATNAFSVAVDDTTRACRFSVSVAAPAPSVPVCPGISNLVLRFELVPPRDATQALSSVPVSVPVSVSVFATIVRTA